MADQAAAPNPLATFLPLLVIPLIFYFIAFRPQLKERKDRDLMLQRLKKNDEVVTAGGLFGTIVNIKSDAVTLRIAENVRVDVERSAIVRLVKGRSENGAPGSTERHGA